MFKIQVDQERALMELTLEGSIREDEMRRFIEQALEDASELIAQGRSIRVLSDFRKLRATSPEAAEVLRQGQEAAMRAGMQRIAEIVSSEMTVLQLNRIARQSGMDRMLRRFHDHEEAWRWLMELE
ncbi:STAS/SEC14 domain-containing protein [Archangium primigenium]|uniref:STAS/SEC14 domain-containing protein n=1 Tax=[Archangium] primigenium TaxID=2792470 RepID=UPI00195827B4|nr:STAS/SEC14 domain-containing protein [Archangium primigenium]